MICVAKNKKNIYCADVETSLTASVSKGHLGHQRIAYDQIIASPSQYMNKAVTD